MAEGDGSPISVAGCKVDQSSGNSGCGGDGNRGGAHHGVMKLAHGECPDQDIHIPFPDLFAA